MFKGDYLGFGLFTFGVALLSYLTGVARGCTVVRNQFNEAGLFYPEHLLAEED